MDLTEAGKVLNHLEGVLKIAGISLHRFNEMRSGIMGGDFVPIILRIPRVDLFGIRVEFHEDPKIKYSDIVFKNRKGRDEIRPINHG